MRFIVNRDYREYRDLSKNLVNGLSGVMHVETCSDTPGVFVSTVPRIPIVPEPGCDSKILSPPSSTFSFGVRRVEDPTCAATR